MFDKRSFGQALKLRALRSFATFAEIFFSTLVVLRSIVGPLVRWVSKLFHPTHQRHNDNTGLSQPRQRRSQPFGFCGLFGVVGARLFDGFGFGFFDKGGVGEAASE